MTHTHTLPLFFGPFNDGERIFHVTRVSDGSFWVVELRDGEEIRLDFQAVQQLGEALMGHGRL